jgi:hypothetical protein
VLTVVRAFKPHVIISVFTGTPRDGHGQHQAAGILAREAYDWSADTARFPRAATAGHAGWTVSKFYRGASLRRENATLQINAGEFDRAGGHMPRLRPSAGAASIAGVRHPSTVRCRYDYLQREATGAATEDPKARNVVRRHRHTRAGSRGSAVAALAAPDSLPGACGASSSIRTRRTIDPGAARSSATSCDLPRCRGTAVCAGNPVLRLTP